MIEERGDDRGAVVVSVDRFRALRKSLFWALPALAGMLVCWAAIRRVDLTSHGMSSRIVGLALAAAALPVAVAAVTCLFQAIRWMLLAFWPGEIGIVADADALTCRLGPFGRRSYDVDRLQIRYPFDDPESGTFESLLPEEEQRASFIPRINHPDASKPLDLLIMRFLGPDEVDLARRLRPIIAVWHARGI